MPPRTSRRGWSPLRIGWSYACPAAGCSPAEGAEYRANLHNFVKRVLSWQSSRRSISITRFAWGPWQVWKVPYLPELGRKTPAQVRIGGSWRSFPSREEIPAKLSRSWSCASSSPTLRLPTWRTERTSGRFSHSTGAIFPFTELLAGGLSGSCRNKKTPHRVEDSILTVWGENAVWKTLG